MTRWQRRARSVIAISAMLFAGVVMLTLKRRDPQPASASAPRADPAAVVEVHGGRVERFRLSREDVRVSYERQLTYADGATRLIGVTITADARAGERTFTVTGNEATVGQNESVLQINGNVQLSASDGLVIRTDHASYSTGDGSVRAPGRVDFSKGRLTGSGLGMNYDTVRDALVISNESRVQVMPDEAGAGAVEIRSGSSTVSSRPAEATEGDLAAGGRTIRFERDVKLERDGQNMESDNAVAHLTVDETQIRLMELRGRSRIAIGMPLAGGLQEMTSEDIDLTYAADGQSLERALLTGNGAIVLAGTGTASGRRISGNRIDVALAPDGATPVALTAMESVVLTLPAGGTVPARTIEADAMESTGQAPRGLSQARFTGNVEYREKSASVNREATASVLDVTMEPGMAGLRDARFSRRVHFVDREMTSDSAEGRYDLARGVLELSGSEPAIPRPRVVNTRITVEANRVDVTLAGPGLKATGDVKSVVNPAQKGEAGTRLPSMFKQDRPVNVTADALDYDSTAGKATYTGHAQLWQDDASLKGTTVVLDDKSGDLTAGGEVTTVSMRNVLRSGKKERTRSIATATSFRYEEATRRAIYTGKAHMNSTDGDITAERLEIYLRPSGAASGGPGSAGGAADDIERAEAFEGVTLKDQNRTTTGDHLVYTTADERYVVTGTPVKVVDECRRETIGRTLTYLKSAETITIDGNEQTRTQTKGSGQCP